MRHVWTEAAEKAGLPGITPYKVKHATASFLSSSGNVYDVQKLLAHSDIGTTQKYATKANMDAIRKLQEMINIGKPEFQEDHD